MILSKARVSERDDQYVFFSQHSKKLYVSWRCRLSPPLFYIMASHKPVRLYLSSNMFKFEVGT